MSSNNNSFEKGGLVGYFKSYFTPEQKKDDKSSTNIKESPNLQESSTETTTTTDLNSGTDKPTLTDAQAEKKKKALEQYAILKRYEELENRKGMMMQVAQEVPSVIDNNIDRERYSRMYLGEQHTENPDKSLWLAGALSGGTGFLIANSFMKSNPIRGLRVFVIFSSSFAAGYYGAQTYYNARKTEIEDYRERNEDIIDEQNFIKQAATKQMYETILSRNMKLIDSEIEKLNHPHKNTDLSE
ncbi:hypothetical protein PPL_09492 [Heterostelium album PN500]|uniref:Uncharacterized protein n=1 Tax=Heterostelium pallidum (strain ATCC 26659 / Pp 5 / PN500) TaxID=670386 RepID=D3BN81_HETP5|nr:hypothetical protein PPL_09492 [Heterostelium album PN500]EFA76741.1 hypothetical protein PPL_09492 [Heterostelium album PN500]|eukprot:XP_020428873.1 hypothetical protein PPL_09492 [Heterostelium album PN500]